LNVAHCCSVVYDYLVTETSTNFTVHYYYVYQAGGGNTTFSKEIVEGCPANSVWNGSDCVAMTYSCPSGGGWILSADQQTCSRCPDPAKPILTPEGACIGAPDKATGTQDCQSSSSNSSDPFLE